MAFSLGLLTKGLLGTSAVTTAAVSIVFKDQIGERINNLFISKDRLNEKITGLGIDQSCHFDNENLEPKTCTLDKTKLGNVKFEKEGSSFDSSASVSLTITKVTGVEAKDYTGNLKFTLKNTSTGTSSTDITLGSNNDTIILKKDVGYDFKIKDGTKLEKAWTLTTLAAKVGLTCTSDTATDCTLPTSGINVWKANDDYITNASVAANSTMSVTKDTKDYNQGFKFEVKDSNDITLNGGTKKKETDGIDKLTKTNKAYEIALKEIGGTKKWFLVEKSTTVPQESQ